jgi:hypothetical protein
LIQYGRIQVYGFPATGTKPVFVANTDNAIWDSLKTAGIILVVGKYLFVLKHLGDLMTALKAAIGCGTTSG